MRFRGCDCGGVIVVSISVSVSVEIVEESVLARCSTCRACDV